LIRVGISGWRYAPWRGVFYPEGLAQRRELEYCGTHFSTVEINGSFYSLQRPEYYAAWYRETPPGFVFAVKGSRYITHLLRLADIDRPLANFFASGILNLKEKLGPFLWQFPETFHFKPERLEAFFELLAYHGTGARAGKAQGCAHDRPLAPCHRCQPAASPCHRGAARKLHRPEVHFPPEEARYRAGGRRHRGQVAEDARGHYRLRLRAPARRQGHLRERLQQPRARRMGDQRRSFKRATRRGASRTPSRTRTAGTPARR
jgi:hypothetical protein